MLPDSRSKFADNPIRSIGKQEASSTQDLLSATILNLMSAGPDASYAVCSNIGGVYARMVLPALSQRGRVACFNVDRDGPTLAEILAGTESESDDRLHVFHERFDGCCCPADLNSVLLDPAPPTRLSTCFEMAEPLDLRFDRSRGVTAAQWLQEVGFRELSHVIDEFALHDSLLSERIAESILNHQATNGSLTSVGHLFAILKRFQDENTHLRLMPLILLALRVAINEELEWFQQTLASAIEFLPVSGRIVTITYNKWELAAVRRFLFDHEEPCEHVSTLSMQRLSQLFPLCATSKNYCLQRVQSLVKYGTGTLHVFEKVARKMNFTDVTNPCLASASIAQSRFSQPPAPVFGCLETTLTQASVVAEENMDEPRCASKELELNRLKLDLANRKRELSEQGLSLSQQRKDPEVIALTIRMKELHRTDIQFIEKLRVRCMTRSHVPVLLTEAVKETMFLGPDKLYVDCTFGRGGHTQELLANISTSGRVKAFDVDPIAVRAAKTLESQDDRFEIIHQPFGRLAFAIDEPVAGILIDLGVSSPQLDDASRGFSLKHKKDGPLDLRMNQEIGLPASEWLRTVSAAQLSWVIDAVGYRLEPLLIERIADAIVRHQQAIGMFSTSLQLVSFLEQLEVALHYEHPGLSLAKLVFYAIRVFLNREMEQLEQVLEGAFERLEMHGRCVIISFNHWEHMAIRRFLRLHEEPSREVLAGFSSRAASELYPLLATDGAYAVRRIVRPIKPTSDEISRNQRSRSSMLHILEKVSRVSANDPEEFAGACALEATTLSGNCDVLHLPRGYSNVGPGTDYIEACRPEFSDIYIEEVLPPCVENGVLVNVERASLVSKAELQEILRAFRRGRGGFRRFGDRQILDFKFEGLPAYRLRQPFALLNPLLAAMIFMAERSLKEGETLALLQLLINYYKDGSKAVKLHKHRCRHICCSLGAARDVLVDGARLHMEHGDCLPLDGEEHGVPATESKTDARVSVCLFYSSAEEYAAGLVGVPAKAGEVWFRHPQDVLDERIQSRVSS